MSFYKVVSTTTEPVLEILRSEDGDHYQIDAVFAGPERNDAAAAYLVQVCGTPADLLGGER